MQCVDKDARVAWVACCLHDSHRRFGVWNFRPRHKFKISGQPKRQHDVAELRVAVHQASEVGLITGHKHGARLQCSPRLKQREIRASVKSRADANNLKIQYGHTCVALRCDRFTQYIGKADEKLLRCARCVRQ